VVYRLFIVYVLNSLKCIISVLKCTFMNLPTFDDVYFFSKSQFIEIIYNEYMYSQSNSILMKHSLCFKTRSFLNCPRICSYATFGVKTYTAVPDNILR